MKKLNVAVVVFVFMILVGHSNVFGEEFELSTNHNWGYVERIDPLTDKDSSIVTNLTSGGRRTAIFFRCDGNRPEILVAFGTYIQRTGRYSQDVTYRLMRNDGKNQKPAVTESWTTGSDGATLFVRREKVVSFAKELVNYDRLVVRAHDYRGTPYTLDFDLTGEEGFISRLSCYKPFMPKTPEPQILPEKGGEEGAEIEELEE